MKIVGIDPGRKTGVAVIEVGVELLDMHTFSVPSKSKLTPEVLRGLAYTVVEWIDIRYQDAPVAIEVPIPVQRSRPNLMMGLPTTAFLSALIGGMLGSKAGFVSALDVRKLKKEKKADRIIVGRCNNEHELDAVYIAMRWYDEQRS